MDDVNKLKEGVIVKGPFWPEEIRVHSVKQLGTKIELKGEGIKTEPHRFYSNIFRTEDVGKISIISGIEGPQFLANPKHFRLALEAKRIRMSYEFDPLFAVGVSKIDPLPHQIEAVYDYLLKRPKIRFLLADDPGAGKTIMAGLLIKELKYRKAAEKILIITPPSLISNWQSEMYEKFNEVFVEVNRETLNSSFTNIWEKENQLIVSIDFLSRAEGALDTLRNLSWEWDLVIFDEAHKLSAYRGSKDEIKRTARYRVGEVLSEKSNHLLFLTATPHSGDPEKFRLLLDLLEKDMWASKEIVQEAAKKDEMTPILRRLKEQMIDKEGNPLFLQRKVNTIGYHLSAQEQLLYDAVTDYVTENFEKIERSRQKNTVGFALIVLQRRLASSVRAIKRSLERRRDKLRDRLENWDRYKQELQEELTEEELETLDDLPEEERWQRENEIVSGITVSLSPEELEFEIKQIERLIELAVQIPENKETKLRELKNVLDTEDIRNKGEKLLIFTEHKDTADYLVEKIEQWGLSTTRIDGSMAPGDMSDPKPGTRVWAMRDFNEGDARVLVATEAAGEGINLHKKCSLMINYDVPWNPNRLEQRMGRIHRYGQKKEVHIYNLIATNTREGRVLEVILEKLEEMRKAIGKDKVYDVISQFIEMEVGSRLDRVVQEAIRNRIDPEEFRQRMRKPLTREDVEKLLGSTEEALAKQYGPMQLLQKYNEYMQITDEQRLIPEYIEQFFEAAFAEIGGTMTRLDKFLWKINEIPSELRAALKKKRHLGKRYGKISFNKEIADKHDDCDFIAPGTVLFDSLVDIILDNYSHVLQQGAIFTDPASEESYALWFVLGKIHDGKGRKIGEKLFAVVQNKDKFSRKGPFIIWDLNPGEKLSESDSASVQYHSEGVLGWSLDNLLEPFLEDNKNERLRDLNIRKKYAEKSLDYMIKESMTRLQKYRKMERMGKTVVAGRVVEERRKYEDLMRRKEDILTEIEKEKEISGSTPEVMATAYVLPLETKDEEMNAAMKRDDEIERIAMEEVMKFEKACLRIPEDVSSENIGYDIKSKGIDQLRYIEVKGRARIGDISLSPNEKIKAERFGDKYWLYAVINCASKPQLLMVQDPANSLIMKKIIGVTRFIVDIREIQKKAEKS